MFRKWLRTIAQKSMIQKDGQHRETGKQNRTQSIFWKVVFILVVLNYLWNSIDSHIITYENETWAIVSGKKKKVLKVTPLDFRNFLRYMYVHIGCSCCCRTMFQSGTPMTKAPLLGLDSGSSILHRHTQTWMQVLVSCLFFRNTDAKLNQKQR